MAMDDELPAHVKFWLNYSKTDCVFNVGLPSGPNEKIGAIKILLIGHSEPLYSMLEESDMAEKGEISLPDIEPSGFKNFLKCVYGGSDVVVKHLTFEECVKLLYIAEKYLVALVKRDVLSQVAKLAPLSINDLFVAFKNQVCLQDETIKKIITESLKSDTDKIVADKRFLDISSEALLVIVQQESLNVKELDVFKALVKWAENKAGSKDGSVLREFISDHLPFIRFRVMTIQEFSVDVIPTGILNAEDACKMCTSIVSNKPHGLLLLSNNKELRFNETLHKGMILSHSFNVENILDGKSHYSGYTELAEYSWQLCLCKCDDYLDLYLFCKPRSNSTQSWECNVTAELILVNQCGKADCKWSTTHKYIERDRNIGNSLIKWADFVDTSQGFIKYGRTIVVAVITLV